ncbi:MAG: amidohydrolase [Candidatus Cloacimonetes bacterium]|nr:amidohydrolase [Candidatus Cloacimonadota bacterium]
MRQLFTNACFHSLRTPDEQFSAVLCEDGIIIEIFQGQPEIAGVEVIDLQGAHVYPGFTDTHTHSFEGGLYNMAGELNCVSSISDVLEVLAETKPIGGIIFASNLDEQQLKEQRFPTRTELDSVCPDKLLLLRRIDGHSSVVNSVAAKQLREHFGTDFSGVLKYKLNGKAIRWFHRHIDEEGVVSAYRRASEIALKAGLTCVHTMIGDADSDLLHYNLIKENLHNFPVRFELYPQVLDIDKALETGSTRIGGCILADGSFGSHTAALKQPYTDKSALHPSPYHSDNFWQKFVEKAHINDLQVFVHAIGDAAIEQIIGAYTHANRKYPKNIRHGIIHCELLSPEMIEAMANENIVAVTQPMFDSLWGGREGMYARLLGVERAARTNSLGSFTRAGVTVTGGSDWYITELNPLAGIYAAMNIHNPEERLSVYEALSLYTRNVALLENNSQTRGTIEPTKIADFTCTDREIAETGQQAIVITTIREGKIVWEASPD